VRRSAAERVTAALAPGLRTRAYVFNTLLAEKMVDDRLRRYPHWLASRNLSNEASDESVEALIAAVRGRFEVPRRWYRLKARLLGLDRLADYDRMAAVTDEDTQVQWSDARDLVLDAYTAFSPSSAASSSASSPSRGSTRRAPEQAQRRLLRVHGARGAPVPAAQLHGRRRDVQTLAHELGHGVHAVLGARQGIFHMTTPLTMAETASVFGESIVFGRLLERAETPSRGSRCWPRTSRTRSRPSSARSR
jgi:oligoendopeptidase F